MKKIVRKAAAYILLAAILAGLCPVTVKESKAASKSVALANLGALGTVSIGKKTKSGNWWMMKLGNNTAFCMNLGYTCHTGDVYQDKTTTYNSSDSGKKGLKAHIGYWYTQTMKRSRKAYVLAQALFWGVEEGDTSAAKLKGIISKVKSNTGYFSGSSADSLYQKIFKNESTFTVKATEWSYAGSGSHRQSLLMLESNKIEPLHVSVNDFYRQRIRLHKVDEDGYPMAGAKFTIAAQNIDELYSYRMNGSTSDADEDISNFNINTQTDAGGWINIRLTYRLQTNDYFFLSEDDLKDMDSNAKKALKESWDDMGYHYASSLTENGAKKLMEKELEKQFDNLNNSYLITETDSGNANIICHPDYKNGRTVGLDKNYSWNRGLLDVTKKEWAEVPEQPFELEIKDNYKKAALSVKKVDGYSTDKKAHGDASLDGAVFGIYHDSECEKPATFFQKDGTPQKGNEFTVKNGTFETGYLRCGMSYYIKELEAPKGYKLKTDVTKITLDGGKYPQDVEYVSAKENVTIGNQPILGKIALQKFYSDGKTGAIHPEVGAVFKVFLQDKGGKNKGTYENCDDYERALLTIDKNGYACSDELYHGKYKIQQVSSGDKDTEKVKDIENVYINNPNIVETRTFSMNNNLFRAYLRIIKKDGNTKKDVLKAGTTYQIYQVDADGKEKLITQEYSNGNKKVTLDKFVTDESGQIMTVEPLPSGKYRIREINTADGYHITNSYIEVEINSRADNYTSQTDKDGNTYSVVTTEYTNYETAGKLSILKKGEQLTNYTDGAFVYEEKQLDGVMLEVYAAGDIVTQDNQKTKWFDKGDLVATITTGKGAVFTSECAGLTGYQLEDNGMVTVSLPLGKYRIKETKTLYGYILADKEWNVEFNWKNKEDTYVLNSTAVTDDKGVMNVLNERAKSKIRLQKRDGESRTGISDAVFGIYTKDNIYNAGGKKIVDAGTRLGAMVTGKDGEAVTDLDLPLMSEQYDEKQGTASGSAVNVSGSALTAEAAGLNSGDYFLKEESVSDGYYLDDTALPVHLEYAGDKTPVIQKEVIHENKQTEVRIDKTDIAGSEEIDGCHLQISDEEENVIASWTSGDSQDITLTQDSGYQNLNTVFTQDRHRIIRGLLQNKTYFLTETRPADGYVTADTIVFRLQESTEAGKTLVSVKDENGNFVLQSGNRVHMVDYKTSVTFKKLTKDKSLLGGAKIEVFDSKGNKVTGFTTKKGEAKNFTGLFKAGETYIFKEVKAPEGYERAKAVMYKVMDTKKKQIVSMTDKKMGLITTKMPSDFQENQNTKSPKTGYWYLLCLLLVAGTGSAGAGVIAWKKGRLYGKKK